MREDQLSMACADLVALRRKSDDRYWLVFSVQNERKVTAAQGAMWNRKGRLKGVSDWIVLHPSHTGQFHHAAIELKVGRNKATKAQGEFLERVSNSGGVGVVIKDVGVFEWFLEQYFEEW